MRAENSFSTAEASASSRDGGATSCLGKPPSFRSSSCISHSSCTALCPKAMASSIFSSDSSFAPASTMVTASFVPATTRSSSEVFRSEWVGFATRCPPR